MGDADAGSSNAAQRALDPESKRVSGLFGRIIGAFTPPDITENRLDNVKPANGTANGAANGATSPLGMLNLRRMRLEDVAVPKGDIIAVPTTIKKDDLVKVFRDTGLTRIPVFKDTLDSPVGLVHLKDFALKHGFNGKGARFNLPKMVRPLLFAPPSMPIGVLLQKMQSQRSHMALVIDEFGGVDGLVTIEDLIEQVIGEIEDEHDVEEGDMWSLEKPGQYLALAKTPLEDFETEIGQQLSDPESEEEYDTLGGLVFMLAGRIPVRGEVILHPNGTEFEIVEADLRRIKRLRVRLANLNKDA